MTIDLKQIDNKPKLQKQIPLLLSSYQRMFNDLINSNDKNDYHKAAILYYWMRSYKTMLDREKNFDPKFLKKYSPGDIIQADLGFNPGNEQGGRHYCIVLDDNPRVSGVVIIMPLRSSKPKDDIGIKPYEFPLGNDIFIQLKTKISTMRQMYSEALSDIKKEQVQSNLDREEIKKKCISDQSTNLDEESLLQKLKVLSDSITKKLDILKQKENNIMDQRNSLSSCIYQFNSMKTGSVALITQVRAISKLRITTPTKGSDPLSGIKISPDQMTKIHNIMKKFYIQE